MDANGDQMLNVIFFVLGKDKNEDLRHKYNISKIADSKKGASQLITSVVSAPLRRRLGLGGPGPRLTRLRRAGSLSATVDSPLTHLSSPLTQLIMLNVGPISFYLRYKSLSESMDDDLGS